jgi:hypothetical protein
MTRFKLIRISIVGSLAAGLLCLGSGAASVAAEFTAGARVDRFTAKVVTHTDHVCIPTNHTLVPIPGTTVKFTQSNVTQAVVVTFVAEWPKPQSQEIPPGQFASGADIFLFIDGQRVDPVTNDGGVVVDEGTATSFTNGTHGFTFVTQPIPPGKHEAKILVLGSTLAPAGQPTGTVCVNDRSTVVWHD